jgi:hypothetical protein
MSNGHKFESLENPNRIRQKVRVIPGGDVADLMARIERAMLRLSDEFMHIYAADVERIDMHIGVALGDPNARQAAVRTIRESLHDLRGQAGTFGYELATQISDSACKFIDTTDSFGETELAVLSMHIEALKVVSQNNLKGDGGAMGSELLSGLDAVIKRHGSGAIKSTQVEEVLQARR